MTDDETHESTLNVPAAPPKDTVYEVAEKREGGDVIIPTEIWFTRPEMEIESDSHVVFEYEFDEYGTEDADPIVHD